MNDEYTIDRVEPRTGWACFQGGETPPPPTELPAHLNQVLCEWLERNPNFTVRATLPITEDGNTVAIHVWFD